MQAIEHKPAKPPRIGKKIKQAIDLLLTGQCKTQTDVCNRLKLSPSYLSRSLKSEKIQAFMARATAQAISAGKLAATSTTMRLVSNARSEHVQLQAAEFILGLNGLHASPSSAPAVTINTGGGGVGYIICLANNDAEVLEGDISDAGGVQYGRRMTDHERRTGQLMPQHRGAMIDITPAPADHPSAQPRRVREEFER